MTHPDSADGAAPDADGAAPVPEPAGTSRKGAADGGSQARTDESGRPGDRLVDDGGDQRPAAARDGRSKLPQVLAIAAAIVLVDQITKIIAVANLTPGVSPRILGGLIYFSLIRNPGAAWSVGTSMTWILALVACGVVVVIIRMASRLRSTWWASSLGLILGGALGNLIDRFTRSPGVLRGHVVDFVSVFGPDAKYFPVFNVADSAITVGAILLVVTSLRGIDFDGSRTRDRVSDDAGSPTGTKRNERADQPAGEPTDPPAAATDAGRPAQRTRRSAATDADG